MAILMPGTTQVLAAHALALSLRYFHPLRFLSVPIRVIRGSAGPLN
jgi:hypothetical protein